MIICIPNLQAYLLKGSTKERISVTTYVGVKKIRSKYENVYLNSLFDLEDWGPMAHWSVVSQNSEKYYFK